jgi:hypothetical protein
LTSSRQNSPARSSARAYSVSIHGVS